MGWSTPRPGRFSPRKEIRYPLHRRLGGFQGSSGRLQEISPSPGFDPQTVQPVSSPYPDWSISARENLSKSKGMGHHITCLKRRGGGGTERGYSFNRFATSALEGSGWSAPRPGRFTRETPSNPCTGGWGKPKYPERPESLPVATLRQV
jgi:hypothetical protein